MHHVSDPLVRQLGIIKFVYIVYNIHALGKVMYYLATYTLILICKSIPFIVSELYNSEWSVVV